MIVKKTKESNLKAGQVQALKMQGKYSLKFVSLKLGLKPSVSIDNK